MRDVCALRDCTFKSASMALGVVEQEAYERMHEGMK